MPELCSRRKQCATESDLTSLFGDLSRSEKLSEIKPPLEKDMKKKWKKVMVKSFSKKSSKKETIHHAKHTCKARNFITESTLIMLMKSQREIIFKWRIMNWLSQHEMHCWSLRHCSLSNLSYLHKNLRS